MKPNLHPSIANTRALITTRWDEGTYRPMIVRSIENYYVDSSLDNDADTWVLGIGDPKGALVDILKRDFEVRVQIFGVGQQGIDYIITGITDDAEYIGGSWTLTGRDLSSLAVDSTARPAWFKKVRAWAIVEEQARFLGFTKLQISKSKSIIRKLWFTDGSESYWDFWYRLYRTEKMWIWTEPDGTLVADFLNESSVPDYYLGTPLSTDTVAVRQQYIPVIEPNFRKNTQGRIYEALVYGHKGKVSFNETVIDPAMQGWWKQPRKVLLDTESHTAAGATKLGQEEIFEGKVGSVEFKITIPDPGFILRQNRVAQLNLPDSGVSGRFFIVGSRIQAGPDGFVQEIRLREIGYALTKRKPEPPVLSDTGAKADIFGFDTGIASQAGMSADWGAYFVKAAKEFWLINYSLFLATLLGICYAETGFQNIRQKGIAGVGEDGVPWHPFVQKTPPIPLPDWPQPGTIPPVEIESREEYEKNFVNDPTAKYGVTRNDIGVGPMQLTFGKKAAADDHFKPGFRNQYEGGRWHPEHNIWIAAQYLNECVRGVGAVDEGGMWFAADAYNRGIQGAKDYFAAHGDISSYGHKIQNYVLTDPGFLKQVQDAADAAQAGLKNPKDFPSETGTKDDIVKLTHIVAASGVDLEHVKFYLLERVNEVGKRMNKVITITSGYRTVAEEQAIKDRYNSGQTAGLYMPGGGGDPKNSNHVKGLAVDCTIGATSIYYAVSQTMMKACKVHCSLGASDPVHVTPIDVNG